MERVAAGIHIDKKQIYIFNKSINISCLLQCAMKDITSNNSSKNACLLKVPPRAD